jgi:hypothetical protein
MARIVVANTLRTRAIAEAKVKTDNGDAESLAQLLRCDYLPEGLATGSRDSGNSVFSAPAWLPIRRGSKTVSADSHDTIAR